MTTEINVQFLPTSNKWDAPIGIIYRYRDRTTTFRRDDQGPEWPAGEDLSYQFIPHGVVMVDGVMSEFDQERQPSDDSARWRMS